MEFLQRSCGASQDYPLNLEKPNAAPYYLRTQAEHLCRISTRTFADEGKAALDFWEYRQNEFFHTPIKSRQSLRDHLNLANQSLDCASLHRFVFIQASSSQTKLLLSEAMLKDLFTYFQVMASVVPLLASFGIDAGKDFHHCQFEADAKFAPTELGLTVPELKRSGRTLEIAYVFRTVEPSSSIKDIPWQIKQTCIYHNFDVETGLNTWIFLKGSDLVKRRIMEGLGLPLSDTSPPEALLFSLSVHLMLSDLSIENWRTYVNSLVQQTQRVTRAMTFKPVEPPKPSTLISPTVMSANQSITTSTLRVRSRSFVENQLSRSSTIKSWMYRKDIGSPVPSLATTAIPMVNTSTLESVPPPIQEIHEDEDEKDEEDEEKAYFQCLQEIKYLEERASEALLVLKSTVRIWKQLQKTYHEYVCDEHFPENIRKECRRGIKQFYNKLDHIQDALEGQIVRVEALIALLVGRKTLLHSILEWRNTKAGNHVAIQATNSSIKMEEMTAHMQDIADRTERETVSMRIITLVTMFFLPGTFISTLMSTDIIQFSNNRKVYSSSALKLFLAISIPMMGATFFAWYMVYLWTNNRERVQRAKRRLTAGYQV